MRVDKKFVDFRKNIQSCILWPRPVFILKLFSYSEFGDAKAATAVAHEAVDDHEAVSDDSEAN